jgi:hypothetical protein
MSVNVSFPESLLVASREDPASFSRKAAIYVLGHLYEQGKLSSGIAAQVLECDHFEFFRLLSEYGFAVIDHSPAELDQEAHTSRAIASQRDRA